MEQLKNSADEGLPALPGPRPEAVDPRARSTQNDDGVSASGPDGLDIAPQRLDIHQSSHCHWELPSECPLCGHYIKKRQYEAQYRLHQFPYGLGDAAANADHVLLDEIIIAPFFHAGSTIYGGDALHSRCLAAWPQKAAFLAHWNRALAEEWPGKVLLDNGAEGFAYTPQEQWSASDRRLQERAMWLEEQERKDEARKIRLAHLEIKKDQGRALVIAAGLCAPQTVDACIYEMDLKDFRLHLAGTGLSRVDFRPDQHLTPQQRSMAALPPGLRELWGLPEYDPDFPDR